MHANKGKTESGNLYKEGVLRHSSAQTHPTSRPTKELLRYTHLPVSSFWKVSYPEFV